MCFQSVGLLHQDRLTFILLVRSFNESGLTTLGWKSLPIHLRKLSPRRNE